MQSPAQEQGVFIPSFEVLIYRGTERTLLKAVEGSSSISGGAAFFRHNRQGQKEQSNIHTITVP